MKRAIIMFVCVLFVGTALFPVGFGFNDKNEVNLVIYNFNGLNVEDISGGMGVTAIINNTGTTDTTNIPWEIYFCSGLVFIGRSIEGTIDVPAGGETTISSGFVFGLGPGSITVTAGDSSKIVSCFILGPFIVGIGPYP